ncbi:MAG TPA: glycosyltransferase family 4 protein [Micromonosporaceae bacterium]
MWTGDQQATWSHAPWQMREMMGRYADVVPVGVDFQPQAHKALKGLHARWYDGHLVSTWHDSRLTDELARRQIEKAAIAAKCDAVFQIQDLAVVSTPFFSYQDMSFDALLHLHQTSGTPMYRGRPDTAIARRQERQRDYYEKATGVLTMSHWLARSLVELSGLPKEKVHVVHPGSTAMVSDVRDIPVREAPRTRLLFIGREFIRKGGDLVVAATKILRREYDPRIRLTVAGPTEWPLPGFVPEWVDFLGPQSVSELTSLYDTHDLFVMPSRLEAFGIVFVEAQARGLPCVARDACAMPEIVEPGISGALVSGDDPADLAQAIADVLGDDALYEKCHARAGDVAAHYSWDRTGREIVEAISRSLA